MFALSKEVKIYLFLMHNVTLITTNKGTHQTKAFWDECETWSARDPATQIPKDRGILEGYST
jgi:hypothetical protein